MERADHLRGRRAGPGGQAEHRDEGPLTVRSSIARLMALVALSALGLAAARAGAFAFTIVALSASAIAGLLSRCPRRAFFLGCSAFGGAAMLLAFGAGAFDTGPPGRGLTAVRAGAFAFTIVALSASAIAVLLSRGPRRGFFLGCSALGGAAMLLAFGAVAFGTGPPGRGRLPTTQAILRVYEMIHGPDPTAFKTREEATQYVHQLIIDVSRAITTGHSLIALALGLVGGTIFWWIARWRARRAGWANDR